MSRNTIRILTLLAGLAGLLVLAGQLLGGSSGAVVGLVLGFALVGGSHWFSDRIAIRAARAVSLGDTEAPHLHRAVGELAAQAGIPASRLYLSPSPQPNVFATGRNESTAVTQGLLDQLSPAKQRGMLAHEIAHIANRDILIGAVAAAIATGIGMVANMAAFNAMLGGGENDDSPGPIAALSLAVVAPLAAGLIQLAVSRSREYEADRRGAQLLGDGAPLAAALVKIAAAARQTPMDTNPVPTSHYIVNPLAGQAVPLAALFCTQPPKDQRVARLLHASARAR